MASFSVNQKKIEIKSKIGKITSFLKQDKSFFNSLIKKNKRLKDKFNSPKDKSRNEINSRNDFEKQEKKYFKNNDLSKLNSILEKNKGEADNTFVNNKVDFFNIGDVLIGRNDIDASDNTQRKFLSELNEEKIDRKSFSFDRDRVLGQGGIIHEGLTDGESGDVASRLSFTEDKNKNVKNSHSIKSKSMNEIQRSALEEGNDSDYSHDQLKNKSSSSLKDKENLKNLTNEKSNLFQEFSNSKGINSDKTKLDVNIIDDDYEKYGKELNLTYSFENMPHDTSFSKFKVLLRKACRITLLGNLEEGLNLFNILKEQKLPPMYVEMIEKNIRDVKYYLRGKYRYSDAPVSKNGFIVT